MPQHTQPTSTLVASERAWRTPVLVIAIASTAMVAGAVAYTFAHANLLDWISCSVPAIALTASNLHYLRTHELPSVGMIPVAAFALLPAARLVAVCTSAPNVLRTACQVLTWVLSLLFVFFAWWFCRLRFAYRLHPDIKPNAALVVLGGAIRKGRPRETLARRLDVAARIWQEGRRRVIVVTGGPTPDHCSTEAAEMARYLQKAGVDPRRIVLERTARNTRENIERSCRMLKRHGFTGQICVVSSDYHLWRALRDARRAGFSLTPVAAPTPFASVPQQWCREVLTILAGR